MGSLCSSPRVTLSFMLRVSSIFLYGKISRFIHYEEKFVWRCQGFTLIEVLIAIVLLSIGFLGLSAMTMGTIQGVSYSENLTTATALARERLEYILNVDYVDIIPSKYLPENYNTIAGYEQFERTVTITDNTPVLNAKTVTVEVVWREVSRATRTVSLSTVIAAPGKFELDSSL